VCGQEASEGSDSVVYKLVGPVLIKNDLDEAKETVDKRLEFISGEM
jgi:prefoldin beta subunit